MKYAIYDKVADAYLTKMIFDVGYSDNTQFECGLNEYITKAELLDTKEAADAAIVRIERFKFMGQPDRFVVHRFDDTLNDQYIISESGNPTKVVDNITVDLDGTINVKYGTMMSHWSSMSVIDRMNALQKSVSAIYTSWNNTFDIYKVITIMDEKEHTHYQFINVTAEGLEKYSKDEKESSLSKRITNNWKYLYEEADKDRVALNKRIDELEKANYELGEQVAERGIVANHLLDENNILKNAIDTIYTNLRSTDECDELKYTLKSLEHDSNLDSISMTTKLGRIINKGNCVTAKDEVYSIVENVIAIIESDEAHKASGIASDIITICEADDNFEVTLKKFSQLYEAINKPCTDDDSIVYAFKSVLSIFSTLENEVRNIIDKNVANSETIARMVVEKKKLISMRTSLAEVIFAILNAIYHNDNKAFCRIENRMKIDSDFNSDPFMAVVRENIIDICAAEKKNISNHELKNSEIAKNQKKSRN